MIELSGQGVVIRTMQATGTWALDSFHPGLRDSAPEQFDAFLENMLILSQHVAEAAADRCIGSVDVNAILSGPDYRQPVSPEHSNDGSHPSEEGSRVIAEALRTLGYESKIGDC
ncbi:MAG: SGNH/GDSL hydrolase family protein [Acidimicrobiia bacterium]|nr:SGNH/GDSL hydrolase family protein [Acidimicrobiia bacterium]